LEVIDFGIYRSQMLGLFLNLMVPGDGRTPRRCAASASSAIKIKELLPSRNLLVTLYVRIAFFPAEENETAERCCAASAISSVIGNLSRGTA
jgi:hypothetical protein